MKLFAQKKFWIGIIIVAIMLGLRYSGLSSYITVSNLQEKKENLLDFVALHYFCSVLVFIASYALIVLFALPLPAIFTLTSGFLFGTLAGTLYSVIGATLGALLFFLMIRHSLGASIQERYKNRLLSFNKRVQRFGISYLIAIRFIAFIPFFLQNILIGLTNVSLATYTWTTIVGVIPGSLVYAYAGQQLAVINSMRDVFSGNVLLAFILLAMLGFVPIIVQKYLTTH